MRENLVIIHYALISAHIISFTGNNINFIKRIHKYKALNFYAPANITAPLNHKVCGQSHEKDSAKNLSAI